MVNNCCTAAGGCCPWNCFGSDRPLPSYSTSGHYCMAAAAFVCVGRRCSAPRRAVPPMCPVSGCWARHRPHFRCRHRLNWYCWKRWCRPSRRAAAAVAAAAPVVAAAVAAVGFAAAGGWHLCCHRRNMACHLLLALGRPLFAGNLRTKEKMTKYLVITTWFNNYILLFIMNLV